MSEEKYMESPPVKKQKIKIEPDSEIETDLSKNVTETTDAEPAVATDKYRDYVNPEELERLKEFKVLDELKSSDEDSNNEDSDNSDGKLGGLPDEEIEKMLEENLPENFRVPPKPKEKTYITRQKIVLEDKGVNQFEVLPLDWMMVRHYSGMPIYMHRTTRVCTLSKPYSLGKGNSRRHDIPITSIPCFAYKRALIEEDKQMEIDRQIDEQIRNQISVNKQSNDETKSVVKNDGLKNEPQESECPYCHQSANGIDQTNQPECNLNKQEVIDDEVKERNENCTNKESVQPHDETEANVQATNDRTNEQQNPNKSNEQAGCETQAAGCPAVSRRPVVLPGGVVMPPPRVETVGSSWKMQHITPEQLNDYCKTLFKFKTVNVMHFKSWADRHKYTKARKALQYPTLPEGTKIITIPASVASRRDSGGKPKRNWIMNMNGRNYLSEFHEYVRRALQKQPVYEFKQLENALQPYQATVYIGGIQYGVGQGSSKRQAKSAAARASIEILIPEMRDVEPPSATADNRDFSFFDDVGIEDPRIPEFCMATCEPSPHAILLTCLQRNFGAGERHIHSEMKKLELQKIEMTMSVGKHSATVVCKNKKSAKQRASQMILQLLHPHVRSWGSLLRLYGSRSMKSCKERKLEEQEITLLQDKARHNEPNYAVIEKLRHEMRKLKERDEAVAPIGTLLLKDDLPTHSGSNLKNVDL
ncbi:microprocessor complex subunit DGCR8-like [Galleria mellonella]|uniref:Microprocessor complex subunit DGCR8-like n=1 Tax=Galleria mellonella TaxID=7137 RepID=A0A6J3C0B7_GALME|nr:microprocessor complex subunit DGCR8-like [Galleria mellonella]XP_026756554.2 microprocessor complex subunit DGCR8-like [Galleria mellonella]XP_026756556.2 microprocessor complex subunit DGCR8-like [Galleria mellonella]XP_031764364.2 microprocessor complex subunit DGCR8-like [Galleria mellonella]XP_052751887.1 microprocessor complex subunit DGCR8-like [Galleria mellonella]XP_052751888.1 microprocessor complex subunit DGCR8-like [Galleria mellonella]XP_052751889.1 microprocessor complex sub